ncbi:MAG: hypothetical protein ACOYD9_07405 [Pyramidobacter sp.]|jgi:hypothetical protein
MNDEVSVVDAETETNEQVSVVGRQEEAQKPDGQQAQAPQRDEPEAEAEHAGETEAEAKQEPAVPEAYTFAMPEGFEVDDVAVEAVTPILKELKCSQEVAQKLADFHFGQIKAFADAQERAREEAIAQWTKELKTDGEIGGPNLKQNLLYGTRLLQRFGSADLDALLMQSGLDRNPAMVRFLVAVGREFAEDRWADGGKHGPAAVTAADVAKKIFDKTL